VNTADPEREARGEAADEVVGEQGLDRRTITCRQGGVQLLDQIISRELRH
jgi:hypothetical protein